MVKDILLNQAEEITTTMPRIARRLFGTEVEDQATELPAAQLRVCAILRDGPHSMSALSRELGITLSATTQIADRLERAGMVERVHEACDRRVTSLQLTAQGTEIMRRRKERRVQRAVQALERLSPEVRETVLLALRTLLRAAVATDPENAGEPLVNEQLEN